MIPPHNSLVKYDNAILVSTTKADGKQGAKQVNKRVWSAAVLGERGLGGRAV